MTSLQIQYFLHVCKTKSISKSAKELFIAQPAISKQITSMEKELGFPLFIRTNRGVILTEGGEQMYALLSEFSVKYDALVQNVRSLERQKQRILSVGLLEGLSFPELDRAAAEMRGQYPDLQIRLFRLSSRELMQRLLGRQLDMVISFDYAADADENIRCQTLMEEEAVFIFSKRHPLALKTPLSPADFSDQVFCEMEQPSEEYGRDFLKEILEQLEIHPRGYLSVENVASGMETVELNQVIGLVDERISLMHPENYAFFRTGVKQKIVAAQRTDRSNPYADFLIRTLQKG